MGFSAQWQLSIYNLESVKTLISLFFSTNYSPIFTAIWVTLFLLVFQLCSNISLPKPLTNECFQGRAQTGFSS